MRDLLERVRREIAAKRGDAAKAKADMDALFASARAEGVDLLTNEDAFARLDEAGKVYDALRDEIAALEGRRDRILAMAGPEDAGGSPIAAAGVPAPERDAIPSAGRAFVASDPYKSLRASGTLDQGDLPLGTTAAVKVLDRAGLKTLVTGGATSGGAFVPEDRIPGLFVDLPREDPALVLALVGSGETDLDVVEYVEQDSRTNAAAETAEAGATGDGSGAAPESAVSYVVRTTTVRDITHFIPATKRVLANAGQLETLLDAELRDGVRTRLAKQVLSGNGTAPNLRGILQTSGRLTQALGADSRSDAIHRAITQLRKEFYEPDALLLTPDDAEQTFLERDANGNYIYGPPSSPLRRTIWGVPVVVTADMTASTGLLGAFRRGSTLWLREGLSVAASDSHSDFFIRRMVAMLAVMRAAFAAHRPKAFVELTGL